QAAKVASDVRRTVKSSFDEHGLEKTFSKIEMFLATFPEDENIILASISLVACTLKALKAGSALSLVSAMLMQGLRTRPSFASVVFFCRQHPESDDLFAGPSALIRSLTAQLLRQDFANFTFCQKNVDMEGLRGGDVGVLCPFFEWLVRQLPQQKTVVCVVDAVETYETGEYEDDLRTVMQSLLRLARDPNLLATVKVLVTSHENTVSPHEIFNEGEGILLMEGLISNGDEKGMMDLDGEL
ncbi:hypothetical protein M406DRAFT_261652, partial [Cryphonectria parasitica EP155]